MFVYQAKRMPELVNGCPAELFIRSIIVEPSEIHGFSTFNKQGVGTYIGVRSSLFKGNPDIRGDFEKGRGWYYGPGVVTLAAALRFLKILRNEVSKDARVILSEAFLSFKNGRTNHSNDAKIIYDQFWKTKPEKIREGTEPILEFISGVPSVRVFKE